MKTLQTKIIEIIKKGEEVSPFLFVAKNSQLAHTKIQDLAYGILEHFWAPKTSLFQFEYTGKNIKVEEIKVFIQKIHIQSSYAAQIFFIENIENLTLQAANSLLKILEEPGSWNLIFLSTSSENTILETILSRVQTVYIHEHTQTKENTFFQDMLTHYTSGKSQELISYFFANKLEKEEYIAFLENIILYAKKHLVFIELLEEINSDIAAIEKNNVNAKYVVDKWLLKIQ